MRQFETTTVAVTADDCELTWADLDRWSNRLARILVRRGARRGSRIAIAVTAPMEAAVTRAAIAKAGATAVPVRGENHSPAADLGVTTEELLHGLDDAVRWVVLDDRSTLLEYLTGSDAPLRAPVDQAA
ncbi:acyl-CoA synthetase (AMP-forming)/AMP-acid ligase II [Nocardia transvalensis]|uniref:Acyl-CoA synthetase (AMP-forming)/AMP-acid ligase II n=1 Tax=Nocardia transvalensis TaxID=37333 RepID=A0A7W9PGE4_9NOCA|nr:AMP-binding protein [Nocardia transvalensis]MBB5915119.1 acyl-CoA synthetase (AMP-forming)/AMP-acid ligase II [Nocardia transvalensis]